MFHTYLIYPNKRPRGETFANRERLKSTTLLMKTNNSYILFWFDPQTIFQGVIIYPRNNLELFWRTHAWFNEFF